MDQRTSLDRIRDQMGPHNGSHSVCHAVRNVGTIIEKIPHDHDMTKYDAVNPTCIEDKSR